MSEKKAADSGTLAVIRDWAVEKFASAPVADTITIATTDWSSLTCIKSVYGMSTSKVVMLSPAAASFSDYIDAGIKCTAQGNGSLTFTCTTVPSANVTVNIIMTDAFVKKPASLAVTGSWTNTQIVGSAMDTTGLTFTVTYNNGSTATVTPMKSPSTWTSSGTQTATFTYMENGTTVSTTKTATIVEPAKYVGGKIFYIDNTATGTYTFKNANGQTVSAPTVGTDCTGWTYTVSGGNGKDKYYVADLTNHTYLNRQYDGTYYIVWATYGEDLSLHSASIDVLSSANNVVGTGRRNSDWIKSYMRTDDVYYPKTLDGTMNRISIWEIRDEANAAKANGCEDWYCPSIGELTQLRNSSGLTLSEWHDAVKYGSNASSYVWASSAYSNSNYAWCWDASPEDNDDYDYASARNNARSSFACVLVRSF